jgi:polysaccharide biosynthesis/export protein
MIASLILLAALFAQQGDLNQQVQSRSFKTQTSMMDYRLGPDDLIDINVFGVEKFNQSMRVSGSGQIAFPYIGKVPAAGLTAAELEAKLTKLLAENKLILDPQVSVFIKEYRSQPVYVLGAVQKPGQYMLTQPVKLIDAIALAGGLNLDRVSDDLFVQRQRKTSETAFSGAVVTVTKDGETAPQSAQAENAETIQINLKELLEKGDPRLNIPIQGGDMVNLPERKKEVYYIIGEVGRPGAYELPRDRHEYLLSQAMSWAGGPLKTAKSAGGVLIRYDKDGKRQQLAVNWKLIITGKEPDIAVRGDDVIIIPDSKTKSIGLGLFGMVPGSIGQAASYSVYKF